MPLRRRPFRTMATPAGSHYLSRDAIVNAGAHVQMRGMPAAAATSGRALAGLLDRQRPRGQAPGLLPAVRRARVRRRLTSPSLEVLFVADGGCHTRSHQSLVVPCSARGRGRRPWRVRDLHIRHSRFWLFEPRSRREGSRRKHSPLTVAGTPTTTSHGFAAKLTAPRGGGRERDPALRFPVPAPVRSAQR
jgi:hypothetical protein